MTLDDDKAQEEKANLRERIATAAMQGLLANQAYFTYSEYDIAAIAINHAVALMKELEGW